MDFTLPTIPRSNFRAGLEAITSFIDACETTDHKKINVCWDADQSFVKPHIILPLTSYISHLRNNGKIVNFEDPKSFSLRSYLSTIDFYKGLSTTDHIECCKI